jgi:hypothetical protein
MLNKRYLKIVALVFVVLVGTAASDGADERAISSPAIFLPAEEQVRATEVAAAAVALPSSQHWYATAEGHVGDINIKTPPTGSDDSPYQVIFRSLSPTGPNYITINNDGPADLKVWIDTPFNPEEIGIQPSFVIKPGQSSSVVATTCLLVKPMYTARPTLGDYVLSWCCPVQQMKINCTCCCQDENGPTPTDGGGDGGPGLTPDVVVTELA